MSTIEGLERLKKWQRASCSLEFNSKDPVSARIVSERVKVASVDAFLLSLTSPETGVGKRFGLDSAAFEVGEYSIAIRFPGGAGFALTPTSLELDEESDSSK